MSYVGKGATGTVLQGAGTGSAPKFSTATYPITAGTASTLLRSDGTNIVNTTATFPSTATGTGTILRADGTNWVATTATYPNTAGSSGNVLTSDGTNWTSAAPAGGGILVASGSLTNAQIKALHGTPVQIIAAPGAGIVVQLISGDMTMTYGGTNAFTAGAAQTINAYYGTAVSAILLLSNAAITPTQSTLNQNGASISGNVALTSVSNTAINLYNPIVTEITGNAANNNTMSYNIIYRLITIS